MNESPPPQLEFELVLPCYNEAKSIATIIRRAADAACEYGLSPKVFRLVLVENGSRDDSRSVMQKCLQDPALAPWFRVVTIDQNQGYGFGLFTGLSSTSAPIVGWSHADQQCDPRDAFKALKILQGSEQKKIIVKGIRHGRSAKEIFISRVFEGFALVLLRMRLHEINAQPKVFSRDLLRLLTTPPKDFAFDIYVLFIAKKNGYRIETFDVQFPPRVYGLSNWAYSLKGRAKTILSMIKYMAKLGT